MTSAHGRREGSPSPGAGYPPRRLGGLCRNRSRVTVERTTLWQRLMLKGWMPERFEAALARLRDTGVIDFAVCFQKHRPKYERLEIPLKD